MTASVPHLLAQSSNQGNPIFTFVLLGLMMGALYFFMIRPQQKRQREASLFVNRLVPGDQVITNGGIYGTINVVEDDCVHLEIDRDVVVRVLKSAIARQQGDAATAQPSGGAADKKIGSSGLSKKSKATDVADEASAAE